MNKSESKYYNTACLMDEALLSLLETKPYDYISVKEICQRAGVNRSTFYLHYESVDDLLNESLAYMFDKLNALYDEEKKAKIQSKTRNDLFLVTPEYILPYLEFLRENVRIFMVVAEKPGAFKVQQYFDRVYSDVLAPILGRFEVGEAERRYLLAFYLSGMHAIILQWLRGGCVEPPEFIAGLLMKYTPHGEAGA